MPDNRNAASDKRHSLTATLMRLVRKHGVAVTTAVVTVFLVPALGIVGSGISFAYSAGLTKHFHIPFDLVTADLRSILHALTGLAAYAMIAVVVVFALGEVGLLRLGTFRSWFVAFLCVGVLALDAARTNKVAEITMLALTAAAAMLSAAALTRWRKAGRFSKATYIGYVLFQTVLLSLVMYSGMPQRFGRFNLALPLCVVVTTALTVWFLWTEFPTRIEVVAQNKVHDEKAPIVNLSWATIILVIILPFGLAYELGAARGRLSEFYYVGDDDPTYAFVAAYGENCFFCEFKPDPDIQSNKLTGRLKVRSISDVRKMTLALRQVGPLEQFETD